MTILATPPVINVLDPRFYVDPWEAYRWLRDEAPVYWDPVQKLWAVSRYDDVRDIGKDAARYSSSAGSRPHIDQRDDMSMVNVDNPQHREQRRLVFRQFAPRAMREYEDHVRGVATEVLDSVLPLGECEAIEAIASRLPAILTSDLLGYPRELWERVRYWSEQTMLLSGLTPPEGPPYPEHPGMAPVMDEFADITAALIKERRAEPRHDLISVWAHASGWDTKRILDETILVIDGGVETTRTVISSMIRELALQPDQRRILLERPGLLATTAVEEFIRWVSPVLNMCRTATADHELHGQHIHAGDQVLLLYAAANRDPRVFPRPDVLDVTRPGTGHLAFGSGPHLCLGMHLARLEIRVMTEELLRRMPDWELVLPGEPHIVPNTITRAYDRIRIKFTPEPRR
jgi:cytochrome P450 family 142 subfamily A polypeptide 1